MPTLASHDLPTIRLDAAASAVETALTDDQRRGLFERPGTVVVAIVELASVTYTGHAKDEDKPPQVKVRIVGAEVARSDEEAAALLEAKRAMWRARRVEGTLDEVGPGPRDPEQVLEVLFTGPGYPSEEDYERHEAQRQPAGVSR